MSHIPAGIATYRESVSALRRAIAARETASEHIKNAIQLLVGSMEAEHVAARERLWKALFELEHGNV